MKKLRALGIGLAVAAVSVTPFFIPHHEAGAQDSAYYNWDQMGILDEKYAYSKIYYTEDTRITAKKFDHEYDASGAVGGKEYAVTSSNGEVVILLENTSAADKKGNKVDVIFRLHNLVKWDAKPDGVDQLAYIYFRKSICGTEVELTSENNGSQCDRDGHQMTLGPDSPIMFWVESRYSNVNFSVEYIKKGSYNSSTAKGTPVSSINRLSFASFDYDVAKSSETNKYDDQLFEGSEGISLYSSIVPSNSKTTFYYQKTNKVPTMNLREDNNGIAVGVNEIGTGFNGIYYANATIATVTGMENSTYTFRYSARNAGICLFFGSPIKYDTPAPKKYVVEKGKTVCDREDGCVSNVATTGDEFNYVISQEIPNQYSSDVDILTFMSLWHKYESTIPSNHFYTSFTINDTIDSNLTPTRLKDIKIYDRSDKDVTSRFNISFNNEDKISVAAKDDALRLKDFYANEIRIVVPVKVNSSVTKGLLKNTAKTTYRQTGDNNDNNKTSNEVETSISHKVTVKHISTATNKDLADPTTETYLHGVDYTTTALAELPKGYKINQKKLPVNASGTVTEDIEVIYYYDLYHTVTTKHISKQNGAEIADPVVEEVLHNSEYETEAAKKLPEGFQLVEVPANATGVVDDDITVIYVYDIPPAPKTLDSDPAPFAFIFSGVGAFAAGAVFFLTRRR